jgi:hypothetical protein
MVVILRATKKVLRMLKQSARNNDVSDTSLGDWYINRVVIDRRPLLLFVSSKSLLTMVIPAQNVKTLPERFAGLVTERLLRLGVDSSLVDSEMEVMRTVRVGPTKDRSVTGSMVDFAKALPYYLPEDGWDLQDLRLAEDKLSTTPCRCTQSPKDVIWPDEDTVRLLTARWGSATTIY